MSPTQLSEYIVAIGLTLTFIFWLNIFIYVLFNTMFGEK